MHETGRPKTSADVERLVISLYNQNIPKRRISIQTGVPRTTVQEIIKRGGSILSETDKPFSVPDLPSEDLPINELLDRITHQAKLTQAAAKARAMIRVPIKTRGPIGLMVWGDPHLDDPGCDFPLLRSHVEIAAAPHRRDYLLSGNIGDLQNNWVGRLTRLYAKQEVSAKNAWRLVEWLMRDSGVNWLFLIRGNHDAWSGSGDPLNWIMRGANVVDQAHGARIALGHPCGVETRIHARHDFQGHSQYNSLHGLKRELLFGERDHIMVAGHRHIGGDACDVIGGMCVQMVRVSGYKRVDDYADAGGYQKKQIHPSALLVIDPSKADDNRSRVWCAPSVEEGVEYLDWLRFRFTGVKPRVTVRSS